MNPTGSAHQALPSVGLRGLSPAGYPPRRSTEAERRRYAMIGKNEELDNYVLKAQGISRVGLNIMCFIGVFIFGWLLAVAFEQLGKKGKGWLYVIPIIFLLVVSRQGAGELALIATIIYIAGWIHANIILSRYESLAKQRISEIDRIPPSDLTADVLLERGLLRSKVLRQTEKALADFASAIQLPGGDPQLLNLAGGQYKAAKRFNEAKQFFDKALELTTDEALVKQIQKNLKFVEKRLK
jgi:tetratricopeptide (TPR) repeat protein